MATQDSTTPANADLPRDLAHQLDSKLMDVVTLLHSARKQAGDADKRIDADKMTDSSSRCVALISMADAMVRDVIRSMGPYV